MLCLSEQIGCWIIRYKAKIADNEVHLKRKLVEHRDSRELLGAGGSLKEQFKKFR